MGAYEYIKQNINTDIITNKFEINDFHTYQKYFYKTDHHWNHKGSYEAYTELVEIMTSEEAIMTQGNICFDTTMSGSKASLIGATFILKEQICAYKFELPFHTTYINGEKVLLIGNIDFYVLDTFMLEGEI